MSKGGLCCMRKTKTYDKNETKERDLYTLLKNQYDDIKTMEEERKHFLKVMTLLQNTVDSQIKEEREMKRLQGENEYLEHDIEILKSEALEVKIRHSIQIEELKDTIKKLEMTICKLSSENKVMKQATTTTDIFSNGIITKLEEKHEIRMEALLTQISELKEKNLELEKDNKDEQVFSQAMRLENERMNDILELELNAAIKNQAGLMAVTSIKKKKSSSSSASSSELQQVSLDGKILGDMSLESIAYEDIVQCQSPTFSVNDNTQKLGLLLEKIVDTKNNMQRLETEYFDELDEFEEGEKSPDMLITNLQSIE